MVLKDKTIFDTSQSNCLWIGTTPSIDPQSLRQNVYPVRKFTNLAQIVCKKHSMYKYRLFLVYGTIVYLFTNIRISKSTENLIKGRPQEKGR